MIDLKKHKLVESKKKSDEHTWRALEEILALEVLCDKSLSSSDKKLYLRKILNDAKLQSIKDSSLPMKINNYDSLISGASLKNINKYTEDVFPNSTNPIFQNIYSDLYINFWRKTTIKHGLPYIFENHDIQLCSTKEFIHSPYGSFPLTLKLTLKYFTNKIREYENHFFKYLSPQRFIEHINAIGHLDKIVLVSSQEAKLFSLNEENVEYPGSIVDFMGLFCPSINSKRASDLTKLTGVLFKKGETAIFLCLENMEDMIKSLKINTPSLEEMLDKVFSHEIGHLAFYFYYSTLIGYEGWKTIAEKQANWICSISHDGLIDSLIEEVTSLQKGAYLNPILLKQNSDPDYDLKVDSLYLRK